MKRDPHIRVSSLLLSVAAILGGCDDSPTEPAGPTAEGLFVLNSTGQTLVSFSVSESVAAAVETIDLGAGFDGDAFDLAAGYAVTTVSSFGGSRILFVDLGSGSVLTTAFPAPDLDLANPSAPSFDSQGTAWIGGRGSDAIYRARPGDATAEMVAEEVGTFIERVVPAADRLYAVDANIDDDGGSYQPLGPGRVVVLSRAGVEVGVIDLPTSARNPTEAVSTGGILLVLASGTFDPLTFLPANDGTIVQVDLATSALVGAPVELEGNGVSLELGQDGLVYITTTSDYQSLDLLVYNPISGSFIHGPRDPIVVRARDGGRVNCWTATGLVDGRIACVTFSSAEAGRLVIANEIGQFVDEVASGFGSTDVAAP